MSEYIERGAAFAILREASKQINTELDKAKIAFAMTFLSQQPAADVEPVVRATWQDGKCTNCGCYGFPTYDGDNERTAFCPHCGAHMMERSGSGE